MVQDPQDFPGAAVIPTSQSRPRLSESQRAEQHP